MKVNSKGQVTIPAPLRETHGLREGDEVDVVEDGATPRIIAAERGDTPGQRLVRRMRGRGSRAVSVGFERIEDLDDAVAPTELTREQLPRTSFPSVQLVAP